MRGVVASVPLRSAPAEYTKFFVDNAIARYETYGLDATLRYYNREESVDGQWYVFIVDESDIVIGHYNAHLLGLDLKGPLGTDAEGYNFAPDMLTATGEGKWISYVYDNPAGGGVGEEHLGAVELKHAWVMRHDGLLFGSGWYVAADEYTKFFVADAIRRYHGDGLEATLAYYNSPESLDGEWFAFVADADGSIIGHYAPEMLGRNLEELFGPDNAFFTPTEEGGWVTITDVNPTTGESESKHAWVVSHDGLVFGSGWYHGESE